jgi:hypothetical protein
VIVARDVSVVSRPNITVHEIGFDTVTVLAWFHGAGDLARTRHELKSEMDR